MNKALFETSRELYSGVGKPHLSPRVCGRKQQKEAVDSRLNFEKGGLRVQSVVSHHFQVLVQE